MYLTENAVTNIDDFLPLSEAEKINIDITFLQQYAQLMKAQSNPFQLKILKIVAFSYYYAIEDLIYRCLIYPRALKEGYRYVPSLYDKGYNYQHQSLPIEYELFSVYMEGFSLKYYKNWIKWMLGRIRHGKLENVLLDANTTALKYLEFYQIKVEKCFRPEFFSPFRPRQVSNLDTISLINQLMDFVLHLPCGQELRDNAFFMQSLKSLTVHIVEVCTGYYLQAESSTVAKKIKNLFIGTQGKLSTRVISEAIKEHGGAVRSFSHMGGFVGSVDHRWLIEGLTATHFYCYTACDVEEYQRQLQHYQLPNETQFILLPQSPLVVKKVKKKKISHVTYLAPLLRIEDFIFAHMLTPNLHLLYFQCQILDALFKEGLKVIFKVHRKDLGSPILEHHLRLLKQRYKDLIIETAELEELINSNYSTDLYISNNVTGGSLIEIMKTDVPVALFTAYPQQIPPKIQKAVQGRIRLFSVQFDAFNRPVINTHEFVQFLSNFNHEFTGEALSEVLNEHFAY